MIRKLLHILCFSNILLYFRYLTTSHIEISQEMIVPDDQAGPSNKRTADGEMYSEIVMERVENIVSCDNEGKIFYFILTLQK